MSAVQQTMSSLRTLKLAGMADAYQRQLESSSLQCLSFDERLAMLVDHETSQRSGRKLKRLVASARMPELATIEEVEFGAARGLERSAVTTLAGCEFVRRNLNLVIVGPTGVGKTYLACAIGTEACRQRLSVLFRNTSELLDQIASADADGSTASLRASLVKPDLLILDDFGIGSISEHAAQVLLSIVDRRMRSSSLLITSQWPTDAWHGFFPNPTVADAILDRVVHSAHRVSMSGESMRKKQAKRRLAGG